MTQTPLLKPTSPDRSIVHYSITWQQFKLIQAGFAESRNIRLSYYDNTIEILMPGRDREFFKTIIGMLLELFCLEKNIEFEPLGSTTQERENEVSLEPDESYCFGESKPRPDLAIEVIFSSGSANKLKRYQVLGIPEVWFWEDGVFSLYHLRDRDYEKIERSEISELATLEIELLSRCVLIAQTSRLEAANTFRNALENNSN
ncbi:Uma2 family endonuclease [Spirulina sp. 06S082]|uniref:Uma2 family endonuclease n=1 Tax=Spirulina sp. 06S082 TaxID=3110248 RepID=UPI002B21707F|nr:Uma2 family endonuclease [Spirulina sp. 06S082]MEA5471485.1 Uma2 family endonuclease [Spirulina sp. 06S082]